MIKTQYINLDMVPSGVLPVLYCSQYDIGRPLGMVVYNGGEAVDLDSYTVTIEATRSDGTAITAAVTTDGNVGAFVTTATMTNQADKYLAKMVIVDSSENRVASLAFVMCVTPKTMDENAESIEEDRSLYQQYTIAVQALIAEVKEDLTAEEAARIEADTALGNDILAEASARETGDTEIGKRFNEFYWLTLTKTTTLAVPSGYSIQGGCYKDGYLYGIYHIRNAQPMLLGKFDLATGALLDSFQVDSTGHGNGVSNFVGDLVLISDSYNNTIYMVDVVQKTVRHTINLGDSTSLSSIGASEDGMKIVLQTPGQNALTGYIELPYTKDGYDHVWYQEYVLEEIPPKGTALVQDLTFAEKNYICCLNTNGYANQEVKKNCVRVMLTNGIHVRDCYFDNALPEPEIITYDYAQKALIIVDREGGVYVSESVVNIFDSTYVGHNISTINCRPATRLNEITNVTATYTDSIGTHSIDMRFPICESIFVGAGVGGDATHRVQDRYAMQRNSDTANVFPGINSINGLHIAFHANFWSSQLTLRYTIVNNAYAELTKVFGGYVDRNGACKALTTVFRDQGGASDDSSFMQRIITALGPLYTDSTLTNPTTITVRGANPFRYGLAAIALPTA